MKHMTLKNYGCRMIEVWTEEIHSMDHSGSLQFNVAGYSGLHRLTYRQWWEGCGLTGETFECSCGFLSIEHPGNGCWQQQHDQPQNHVPVDALHADLVLSALEEAKAQGIGIPAEYCGLAMLVIADLSKRDKSSMHLIKAAQNITQSC